MNNEQLVGYHNWTKYRLAASFETCQTKSMEYIVLFVADHLSFFANTCLFFCIRAPAHIFIYFSMYIPHPSIQEPSTIACRFGSYKSCLCTANVPALHWPLKGPCSTCRECSVVCLVMSPGYLPSLAWKYTIPRSESLKCSNVSLIVNAMKSQIEKL